MEAFVCFELSCDGIYYAVIEPDFNVLPLIIKHFKARYADQKWVIFDQKRHYGMYYDGSDMQIISEAALAPRGTPHAAEVAFQRLWQIYFRHTNIQERKNNKLHLQHVPMRYWKYLSEKKPILSHSLQ